jgi:phage terminase small subunit
MSLNNRQKLFVDYYVIYRNASKAAKLAGYNGKSNTYGPYLLANLGIQAEIEKRLREKHLSADEVLARLSDMAYADIRDFANIESPSDLLKPRYRGKTHVIKKFKKVTTHTRLGDTITTTELELHDSRQTLVDLGRYHKLFTDKVELSWRDKLPPDKNPDEVLQQFSDLLKLAAQNA